MLHFSLFFVLNCREFFSREGGRNSVEFFKENNVGDGVYIALKFESKSIAKEILNRLIILQLDISPVIIVLYMFGI